MSYAMSAPLQAAVYQRLVGYPLLQTLVGNDIFDAAPHGPLPELYVLLGAETVRDGSDVCDAGAWHDFTISVVSDEAGFHAAKEVAGAVSDALENAPLSLSRGRLAGLWFRRADARRVSGGQRRVDLVFRAKVEDVAV